MFKHQFSPNIMNKSLDQPDASQVVPIIMPTLPESMPKIETLAQGTKCLCDCGVSSVVG